MADKLPEITEHTVVATDFIDGLHDVYVDRNGNARLVFYFEDRDTYDGKIKRVVQAKMVMPYGAMIEAASLMVAAVKAAPERDPERRRRLAELN